MYFYFVFFLYIYLLSFSHDMQPLVVLKSDLSLKSCGGTSRSEDLLKFSYVGKRICTVCNNFFNLIFKLKT